MQLSKYPSSSGMVIDLRFENATNTGNTGGSGTVTDGVLKNFTAMSWVRDITTQMYVCNLGEISPDIDVYSTETQPPSQIGVIIEKRGNDIALVSDVSFSGFVVSS